jgi:hypothetical protein
MKKNLHVNLEMLTKLFHEKVFVVCKKIKKIGAQKALQETFLYLFYSRHKYVGFREIWRAHIECRGVRVNFLFNFF